MINFSYDTSNPFDLYKAAVERKRSDDKMTLASIEGSVRTCYDDFDDHRQLNTLETMAPASHLVIHKDSLIGLYGPKKSIIKTFRDDFFRRCKGSYKNVCPYCTLNEADTTDHILPKDKYPEFAINVHNLIPVCSSCNSKKGDIVTDENDERVFINYYNDVLPEKIYLVAEIYLDRGMPVAKYRLENVNDEIDAELFKLIKRHFEKLELINRFNDKGIQIFSTIIIEYMIEHLHKEDEYNVFASKQIEKCKQMRSNVGYNHWEICLRYAAATSTIFRKFMGQIQIPVFRVA